MIEGSRAERELIGIGPRRKVGVGKDAEDGALAAEFRSGPFVRGEEFGVGSVMLGRMGINGFVFDECKLRCVFWWGGEIGFVCQFFAEFAEAIEIGDGAAVQAFCLRLVADGGDKRGGFDVEVVEAVGEKKIAILGLDDGVFLVDEVSAYAECGASVGGHGVV